jgi:hypothetical protein
MSAKTSLSQLQPQPQRFDGLLSRMDVDRLPLGVIARRKMWLRFGEGLLCTRADSGDATNQNRLSRILTRNSNFSQFVAIKARISEFE